MPKVLYIISNPEKLTSGLLPKETASDQETRVLLIEDAVTVTEAPGREIFVLADDAMARKITSTFPKVSYADMVRLIFESDHVVTL